MDTKKLRNKLNTLEKKMKELATYQVKINTLKEEINELEDEIKLIITNQSNTSNYATQTTIQTTNNDDSNYN